jgi:hypothetical protein
LKHTTKRPSGIAIGLALAGPSSLAQAGGFGGASRAHAAVAAPLGSHVASGRADMLLA